MFTGRTRKEYSMNRVADFWARLSKVFRRVPLLLSSLVLRFKETCWNNYKLAVLTENILNSPKKITSEDFKPKLLFNSDGTTLCCLFRIGRYHSACHWYQLHVKLTHRVLLVTLVRHNYDRIACNCVSVSIFGGLAGSFLALPTEADFVIKLRIF